MGGTGDESDCYAWVAVSTLKRSGSRELKKRFLYSFIAQVGCLLTCFAFSAFLCEEKNWNHFLWIMFLERIIAL